MSDPEVLLRAAGSVAAAEPGLRGDRAKGRRWPGIVCVALLAGGLTWGGWLIVSARRFESGLAEVRKLMDADQFDAARERLRNLPWAWSNGPEVAYRLGVCEHASGDIPAALAAWSRVDLRSDWGVRAGLARAGLWSATSASSATPKSSSRGCSAGAVLRATRCATPSRSSISGKVGART